MIFNGFELEHTELPNAKKLPFIESAPVEQNKRGAKLMVNFMSSCPGKFVISGITGLNLGGVLGIFIASMAYDPPLHSPLGSMAVVNKIAELPIKQQIKLQLVT